MALELEAVKKQNDLLREIIVMQQTHINMLNTAVSGPYTPDLPIPEHLQPLLQ